MSRKDYQLIAGVLREELNRALSNDEPIGAQMVVTVAGALAGELKADNPGFDRAKFLAASGVETIEQHVASLTPTGTLLYLPTLHEARRVLARSYDQYDQ